ncbi:MAG: LytTR family DNA-binding domain-containing protein [Flavobacteriaceae bacterium]|nr:LytTR family DNA-binding domain-containing protein [Flavobacteriaceae bacterium]
MDKKCIIIDRDSKNLEILKILLEKSKKFTILSSFDNFKDSKEFLSSISVDLIFIGFTLPVFSPFNFLDSLKSNPLIVFISDQTEHAFKSFDYNTLDYIQTPLNEEKIEKIVKKLNTLNINSEENNKSHLYLKSNLKKRKVYTKDIKWVEALGDYVKVITSKSNIIVLSSLRNFEKKLPTNKFLRIHKSYIINLDKIDNITSKTVEIESSLIPISRNKKADLDKILKSN